MKGALTGLAWVALSLAVSAQGVGRGKVEVTLQESKISVEYGRPELRGRDMLAKAETGLVWRMGADQATILATQTELIFGDVRIRKGKYSLFAKKVETEKWLLIVNSETGIWGTNHNSQKDVATVPLKTLSPQTPVEKFTITLKSTGQKSGQFSMVWGQQELVAAFTVD